MNKKIELLSDKQKKDVYLYVVSMLAPVKKDKWWERYKIFKIAKIDQIKEYVNLAKSWIELKYKVFQVYIDISHYNWICFQAMWSVLDSNSKKELDNYLNWI